MMPFLYDEASLPSGEAESLSLAPRPIPCRRGARVSPRRPRGFFASFLERRGLKLERVRAMPLFHASIIFLVADHVRPLRDTRSDGGVEILRSIPALPVDGNPAIPCPQGEFIGKTDSLSHQT